jgi:outer membrane lipoprotein-sorting protein
MNRRALLLSALLLAFAAPALADPHAAVLSDADQAALQQVQDYLNGLRSLKGRFLQTAPDGQTAQGTAWLERPGRMRFEYDPPSPLLLVAGHGLVVFHDAKLGQTTNIPMGQTPLGLLLRDKVSLTGDVTVTDFVRQPGQMQVTAVKTASPGDGSLTLMLNADPLALVGWSVVDAQGQETRIRLSDVVLGGTYPEKLFTFIDPSFFDPNGSTP